MAATDPATFLESAEASRRLGIKRATLYAYVSRGLLRSYPAPPSARDPEDRGGRGARRRSLFAAEEVEALARRSRGDRQSPSWTAPVTTSVTRLHPSGPVYRDVPLASLMGAGTPFEAVAELLWDEPVPPHLNEPPRRMRPTQVSTTQVPTTQVPTTQVPTTSWPGLDLGPAPSLRPADLLRWITVMTGAAHPGRADLRRRTVCACARTLIVTMARMLSSAGSSGDPESLGVATLMAHCLTGETPPPMPGPTPAPAPALVRTVNAAMVALADHELAASTMAVRLAASTRAGVYDAVLAGLATMAGPLHGGASPQVHALLDEVERRGAPAAVDQAWRWQGRVPGFGHALAAYGEGDPRVPLLLPWVEAIAEPEPTRWAAVHALLTLAREQSLPPPNVDLALGALTFVIGADPVCGELLFTVARVAGWVAHYLEELDQRPLRFRTQAIYASPRR